MIRLDVFWIKTVVKVNPAEAANRQITQNLIMKWINRQSSIDAHSLITIKRSFRFFISILWPSQSSFPVCWELCTYVSPFFMSLNSPSSWFLCKLYQKSMQYERRALELALVDLDMWSLNISMQPFASETKTKKQADYYVAYLDDIDRWFESTESNCETMSEQVNSVFRLVSVWTRRTIKTMDLINPS